MPNNQLLDLEERQDKLLQKLDILYERIKTISSLCTIKNQHETINKFATTVSIIKKKYIITQRTRGKQNSYLIQCPPWSGLSHFVAHICHYYCEF